MKPSKQPRKTLRADAARLIGSCAGLGSRLAARRITQFLEGELVGANLTLAQLGLMAQLAAAPDDTIAALARRTGLDQSTLSRNLRALEVEGLVEIAIVETDLRRRAVWLTEKGARRLEQVIPLWRDANVRLSRHVDSELVLRLARESERLP
ncbi:winged helix-turn-helix transcriptional regulator [Bradyrhizobium manausense]|uniref:MarR family winged helix-turn-helix transcriptional regulator n=1 Tax=Bradyrhizobium manausense TaxID=989370 RepID=UPI001BA83E7F|nr:MarR family winged helix-turn-helix transcriptional regulator [Bradyrhizobium manausense]MBR1090381.1 winged helix-turn-helix transcriptional regulator [Bradyrhizobium manausense]